MSDVCTAYSVLDGGGTGSARAAQEECQMSVPCTVYWMVWEGWGLYGECESYTGVSDVRCVCSVPEV